MLSLFVIAHCLSFSELFFHKIWNRNDTNPLGLVPFAGELYKAQVGRDVLPRQLSYFFVRAQKAAIGDEASEVQVIVELPNLLEHSCNIFKRFVHRCCDFTLLDAVYGLLSSRLE